MRKQSSGVVAKPDTKKFVNQLPKNIDKALHFARNIGAGMCHINGPTIHDEAHIPFGGNGESGVGREGTDADMEAMTEIKWITVQL